MAPLQLTDFQAKLVKVLDFSPLPGRFAALNALQHLKKAWELRSTDREMAVFRGITAEEESVTAIFRALRQRRYDGADRLKSHRHDHKAGVTPFFSAIEHALVTNQFMAWQPVLALRRTAEGARLVLKLRADLPGRGPSIIEPIPPLHGIITVNGEPWDFGPELAKVASISGAKSIGQHIRTLANERNLLLYASDRGMPSVGSVQDWYFVRQRDRLFTKFMVFLLIVQEKSRQDFVQQALTAYLRMLDLLPKSARDESLGSAV